MQELEPLPSLPCLRVQEQRLRRLWREEPPYRALGALFRGGWTAWWH
jgi:hypothetical protein